MEFLIIPFVGLIVFLCVRFLFSLNEEKKLEAKWNDLLTTTRPELEPKKILAITDWISSRNGYWEIYGLKEGENVNMSNYSDDILLINQFDLVAHWDGKSFHGKDWIPNDMNNLFVFYQE